MSDVKIISFVSRLESFDFLGVWNIITDQSDFGDIWSSFFAKGGYERINPYAADPNCVNIWLCSDGNEIYFQGKIVQDAPEVPDGYAHACFPTGEYLVVTTDWLPSYEAAMQHINHSYHENAVLPPGYKRRTPRNGGITLIERWGAESEHGYRYEFWLPIEQA